jgi:REP element-mobilizing transposase RayT
MSNHIHLIVSSNEPIALSEVLRGFKKYTSSKIIKAIEENEQESRRNCLPAVRQGCYGYSRRRVRTIKEMGSINFGDKIIIR